MKFTFRELADRFGWDETCGVLGWNPWFAKEGLGSPDEVVDLSEEQLRKLIGLKLLDPKGGA